MPAPNSVTDSSRLSDLAPKARMDEIPDSGSLSSQRRFAELQATPGSHAPGVILNGGRLKRDSSCRGFGGAPSSKNSLESPFGKGGRVARQVQQDAAGVRGVPEIPAPRFHEDKLRGNDTRRAGTGACPYGVREASRRGIGVSRAGEHQTRPYTGSHKNDDQKVGERVMVGYALAACHCEEQSDEAIPGWWETSGGTRDCRAFSSLISENGSQ
jgi:hypothetical protein